MAKKPKGWQREPARHSLAARGIKSGRKKKKVVVTPQEPRTNKILDINKGEEVKMTKQQQRAFNVVDSHLRQMRAEDKKYADKDSPWEDPLADTRIVLEDNQITLQYDGAGYEYFSAESDGYYGSDIAAEFPGAKPKREGWIPFSEGNREAFRKRLKGKGLDFEDNNNWSMTIFED